MKKLLLVLCVTVGCFWCLPVFAKPTQAAPSDDQQQVPASTAPATANPTAAQDLVNRIRQSDLPVETTGSSMGQVGQPVNEPQQPSVHPIEVPAPATQSTPASSGGVWQYIKDSYADTYQRIKSYFQPPASTTQPVAAPSTTTINNQPAVAPFTSTTNTQQEVVPSTPTINNQPAATAPSPVSDNNPAPSNNIFSNISNGITNTVQGAQNLLNPKPPAPAPMEVGAVRDAVADNAPATAQQQLEQPPAPADQQTEQAPAPAGSEQQAEEPPAPAAEQQAQQEPVSSGTDQQGVKGLPGIYLNDNTGNGTDKGYGIPGLPGVNTNGPGEGSNLQQPAVAPSEPAGSEQQADQPPEPAGAEQQAEQPADQPPEPSGSEQQAQTAPEPGSEQQQPAEAQPEPSSGQEQQPAPPAELQQQADASQAAAAAPNLEDASAKAQAGFDTAIPSSVVDLRDKNTDAPVQIPESQASSQPAESPPSS